MVKRILLLILTILLLCGCGAKKEENVSSGDGEDEFFTILSRENSYSYPSLDMVNVKIEGNKSLVMVPAEAVVDYNRFYSPVTFAAKYDILVNTDANVEEMIESMVVGGDNVEDSGLVVTNGTYSRYIRDPDTDYTTYYYGAAIANGYVYITISFFDEELRDLELEVLKAMKDVYLMDTLQLPESVIVDVIEENVNDGNVEDVLEETEVPPAEVIAE